MSSFAILRSTTIAADPARVHALVNDFHQWPAWSPWEGLDPALRRTYSGADAGVGAHYSWAGNRRAGEGSMEITGSSPERVDIELVFVKPFKGTNQVALEIVPAPSGTTTDVHWRMTGEQRGLMALVGRIVPMDRLVGKDFEKGLARLKVAAES